MNSRTVYTVVAVFGGMVAYLALLVAADTLSADPAVSRGIVPAADTVQTDRSGLMVALHQRSGHFANDLSGGGLVDVQEVDSTLLVDLKYSSTDNFLGVDVYGTLATCYLHREVAVMLGKAHAMLKSEQPRMRLLIYDGARPRRIQRLMWKLLEDNPARSRYLADPEKGSMHNYGVAVDLTISDEQGNPLDMGTAYDFFGPLAHPSLEQKFLQSGELTAAQVENRKLLRKVMKGAGFQPIETEWWHFSAYGNEVSGYYPIIE